MARKILPRLFGPILASALSALAGHALVADSPSGKEFDTKLPGVSSTDPLADGGWICSTLESIYISTADPKVWELRKTGLPSGYGVHRCAGGSRNRMYLVVQPAGKSNHDLALYAVEPGKKPAMLRALSGIDAAGFCSETTGVLSTGANVGVTVDGGATWHPTPPLFEAANAEITLLRWVDQSRLLLSNGRLLALYELQPGATLRRVWRVETPTDCGIWTRSCDCDDKQVWLMGKNAFHRLRLESGQQDMTVPRSGSETNFRVVDGGLVSWGFGASKLRAMVQKPDGTYTAGKWFALEAPCGVIPLANPHLLVLTVRGAAYDLNFVADSLTPAPLHVTPQWSAPPDEQLPADDAVLRDAAMLEHQLTSSEVVAIGTRLMPARKSMSNMQWLATYRDELQRAVDKHKLDGTLPPPRPLMLPHIPPPAPPLQLTKGFRESPQAQISLLESELSDDEVRQVWAEARLKGPNDAVKALLWVKGRLEKLVAKHKADGTLRMPEAEAPAAGDAPPKTDSDSLVAQILHLGLQLPEDEVKQAWAEARRKERDPVKQRQSVKDQLEKLVAKHKADGILPKPKSEPPDSK